MAIVMSRKIRKVCMSKSNEELTPKMKLFCEEYAINQNAYQACIKAGYSDNYAKGKSSQLLKDDRVQAYIRELVEKFFINKFDELSRKAVQELENIMLNEDTTPTNKLKAIDMILKYSRIEDKINQKESGEDVLTQITMD